MPRSDRAAGARALADPTRRDMVARLAVGDATVNELAEPYAVTVQAVSKHLEVLEDAGLAAMDDNTRTDAATTQEEGAS